MMKKELTHGAQRHPDSLCRDSLPDMHRDRHSLTHSHRRQPVLIRWLIIGLILVIIPACNKREPDLSVTNTDKQDSNTPVIQGLQKVPLSHSEPFTCHPERSEGSRPVVQGKLREESHSISDTNYTYYTVTRVVDGDTIVLSDKTKVRYIGIDTPPSKGGKELDRAVKRTGKDKELIKKLGKEASESNRKLVESKKVRLEYDVQKTDKYGRTLAYVYLENGIFVNAWLVENGFARVSTYPPNVKYQNKFIELERKAREERRGLWEMN